MTVAGVLRLAFGHATRSALLRQRRLTFGHATRTHDPPLPDVRHGGRDNP